MVKRMIFKPVVAIIVVHCFVATSVIAGIADNGVQEDRGILLGQIRELMEKKHVIVQRGIPEIRFEKYRMLLEKLAVATAGKELSTSKIDLENTIVAIAQNYHDDPNLMDELIADYGSWKGDKRRRPVALHPQALKDKHATEKYRLTWEALLLAPETKEIRFMERRIFEPFQRIDNPESIPALVEAFRLTTLTRNAPQFPRLFDRQIWIISVLTQWPEERTLTALFRCLDFVDKRNEGQEPEIRYDGSTMRWRVFKFITLPDNRGITKREKRLLRRVRKWKAVVDKYSVPVHSEQNKQLFERLKSHTLPKAQD